MIPDIQTGQRTYYLSVSATGNNASQIFDIPFVDTSGRNINCNYFTITGGIGNVASMMSVVAELSGVSKTGNMITNGLSALRSTINTSGICGVGFAAGGGGTGTATWHACNGEVCNGVKIQVLAEVFKYFVSITYGNLLPYNILRSDMYNKGI